MSDGGLRKKTREWKLHYKIVKLSCAWHFILKFQTVAFLLSIVSTRKNRFQVISPSASWQTWLELAAKRGSNRLLFMRKCSDWLSTDNSVAHTVRRLQLKRSGSKISENKIYPLHKHFSPLWGCARIWVQEQQEWATRDQTAFILYLQVRKTIKIYLHDL